MLKRLQILLLSVIIPMQSWAENNPEMADAMRQDGKIYTVVVVLAIILAGFFIFLVLTDRKVSKLENQMKDFLNK